VYIAQTPVRHTSRCDQRLEAAPRARVPQIINKAVGQWRKRFRASMKAK